MAELHQFFVQLLPVDAAQSCSEGVAIMLFTYGFIDDNNMDHIRALWHIMYIHKWR